MTQIELGPGDWQRSVAGEAAIPLINRYYEEDPIPLDGNPALLARPGLKKWLSVGDGPIKGIFCQLGTFSDALFVVSGSTLYRINTDETVVTVGTGINVNASYVSMCVTSVSQDLLFVCDGGSIWYYNGTSFTSIAMPDSVGAGWIDTIAQFVIVTCSSGFGVNGRFYWLQPAATTIDALDFATAERSPDPVYSVITVGDQFWLFGSGHTEVWYPTGDGTAPFQRIQGKIFDKGIWGGTAVRVGDDLLVVDRDGTVWQIGQGITRVSNYGIEQQIREAIVADLRNS